MADLEELNWDSSLSTKSASLESPGKQSSRFNQQEKTGKSSKAALESQKENSAEPQKSRIYARNPSPKTVRTGLGDLKQEFKTLREKSAERFRQRSKSPPKSDHVSENGPIKADTSVNKLKGPKSETTSPSQKPSAPPSKDISTGIADIGKEIRTIKLAAERRSRYFIFHHLVHVYGTLSDAIIRLFSSIHFGISSSEREFEIKQNFRLYLIAMHFQFKHENQHRCNF